MLKNLSNGENRIDLQITIPLAVGGAVGGVVGKQSYSSIAAMYPNPDTVGAWQAALLALFSLMGSILAAWLVSNLFFKKGGNHEE